MTMKTALALAIAISVKTLTVNDVHLAYVEEGTGQTVVFVHGAMGDWRTWEDVRPLISAKYRFVSLSRRYHYPNAWTDKGEKYSRSQHVEDVAAFIRALKVGKVHLVGNSYGGGIAARVALKYPDLLRSVVIGEAVGMIGPISADYRTANDALQQQLGKARAAAKAGDGREATRLFFDAVVEKPGAFDQLSTAAQEQRLANANTLALGTDDPTPVHTCEEVRGLKVPALVVQGEQTRVNFRHGVRDLLSCLPKGTPLAIIPRAHHGWHVANPEDSAKAILAFIAKH